MRELRVEINEGRAPLVASRCATKPPDIFLEYGPGLHFSLSIVKSRNGIDLVVGDRHVPLVLKCIFRCARSGLPGVGNNGTPKSYFPETSAPSRHALEHGPTARHRPCGAVRAHLSKRASHNWTLRVQVIAAS